MTAFQQKPSGLVVPVEKPKAPAREHGPLELRFDEERDSAGRAIVTLLAAMSNRFVESHTRKSAQRKLVKDMAQLLLGDIQFEEKT